MGKGNGGTRFSSSNSPRGLSDTFSKEEASIKESFAQGRENSIKEIENYRESGKAGELVNKEIDKAIGEVREALKKYEDISSVEGTYWTQSEVHKELGRIAWQLNDKARTQEANANDATNGQIKKTFTKAANALGMAAWLIGRADGYITNEALGKLESGYRVQNKWKQ